NVDDIYYHVWINNNDIENGRMGYFNADVSDWATVDFGGEFSCVGYPPPCWNSPVITQMFFIRDYINNYDPANGYSLISRKWNINERFSSENLSKFAIKYMGDWPFIMSSKNHASFIIFNPDESFPANEDYDGDGLTNFNEMYVYFTNPAKEDTDEDGLSDIYEIEQGTDPTIADSDNDGLFDFYDDNKLISRYGSYEGKIVTSNEECVKPGMIFKGNLIINSGEFNLNKCDIQFDCDNCGIIVNEGGAINIVDSKVSGYDFNKRYTFNIDGDAYIDNSDIFNLKGGIVINSDNVILKNSKVSFSDSEIINIKNSAPLIENNEFFHNYNRVGNNINCDQCMAVIKNNIFSVLNEFDDSEYPPGEIENWESGIRCINEPCRMILRDNVVYGSDGDYKLNNDVEEIKPNQKKMSKYSEKEVFLISDKDWRDVLSLVPVTTWTDMDGVIHNYPTLIYHEEVHNLEGDELPYISIDDSSGSLEYVSEGFWQSFVAEDDFIEKIIINGQLFGESYKVELWDDYGNFISESISSEATFEFIFNVNVNMGETYKIVFPHSFLFVSKNNPYKEGYYNENPEWDVQMDIYGDNLIKIFDADSIIDFIKQFDIQKVTMIGFTPNALDELIASYPDVQLGAGLTDNQINRINIDSYFSYWDQYRDIIYVQNDYSLALFASTYASLINAPLIIEGTSLDNSQVFFNKKVICLGDVDRQCDENYNLRDLQKKYVEITNTNKIILVNPSDLDKAIYEELIPESSSNPIYNLFTKTSLAAPILASGKHELIIQTGSEDYKEIKSQIILNLKDLLNLNLDTKTCSGGDLCSSGYSDRSKEVIIAKDHITFNFNPPSFNELGIKSQSLGFYFDLLNCEKQFGVPVLLYINGAFIRDISVECKTQKDVLFKIMLKNFPLQDLGILSPGDEITLKFDGDMVIDPENIMNYFDNINEVYSCNNLNNNCLDNIAYSQLEGVSSGTSTEYVFTSLDTNKDYILLIKTISEKLYNGYNIYLNNELIGTIPLYNHWFKNKRFIIPKEKIISGSIVKLTPIINDNPYRAEIKMYPDISDFYLTIISANVIPFKEFTKTNWPYDDYRALDPSEYADLNYDNFPDLSIGRIQGLTLSDVTSYIARDLNYEGIDDRIALIVSSLVNWIKDVEIWQTFFENKGYDLDVAIKDPTDITNFDPNHWINQDLIYYRDHGNPFWAGIYSWEIPLLKNSILLTEACLTCNTYDKLSYCNTAIRKGAIAHIGAVAMGDSDSFTYMDIMSRLFYDGFSIGKSFSNSYDFKSGEYVHTLLGDPTLDLHVPNLLNEPLKKWYNYD
ncbi:C25 family cysteine peptidase, partial [Nanoarchaeota archaeon]